MACGVECSFPTPSSRRLPPMRHRHGIGIPASGLLPPRRRRLRDNTRGDGVRGPGAGRACGHADPASAGWIPRRRRRRSGGLALSKAVLLSSPPRLGGPRFCHLLPHQHAVDATTVHFYPTGTLSTRSLRENTAYTGGAIDLRTDFLFRRSSSPSRVRRARRPTQGRVRPCSRTRP